MDEACFSWANLIKCKLDRYNISKKEINKILIWAIAHPSLVYRSLALVGCKVWF
jgi:hypothetical protein